MGNGIIRDEYVTEYPGKKIIYWFYDLRALHVSAVSLHSNHEIDKYDVPCQMVVTAGRSSKPPAGATRPSTPGRMLAARGALYTSRQDRVIRVTDRSPKLPAFLNLKTMFSSCPAWPPLHRYRSSKWQRTPPMPVFA